MSEQKCSKTAQLITGTTVIVLSGIFMVSLYLATKSSDSLHFSKHTASWNGSICLRNSSASYRTMMPPARMRTFVTFAVFLKATQYSRSQDAFLDGAHQSWSFFYSICMATSKNEKKNVLEDHFKIELYLRTMDFFLCDFFLCDFFLCDFFPLRNEVLERSLFQGLGVLFRQIRYRCTVLCNACRILAGRTLVFIGDSRMRLLFMSARQILFTNNRSDEPVNYTVPKNVERGLFSYENFTAVSCTRVTMCFIGEKTRTIKGWLILFFCWRNTIRPNFLMLIWEIFWKNVHQIWTRPVRVLWFTKPGQ